MLSGSAAKKFTGESLKSLSMGGFNFRGSSAASRNQSSNRYFTAEAQSSQRGTAATKSENRHSPQRTQSSQRFFISKSLSLSPPRLRGEFSISSQLANNFDYCSA